MKNQKTIYTIVLIQALALFSFVSCVSCSSNDDPEVTTQPNSQEPIEGMRIAWDYQSMQKISPSNGRSLAWTGYPRFKRLKNQSILISYEANGNVEFVISKDDGQSWSSPIILFEKQTLSNDQGLSTLVNMSNGELIELSDGTLLGACNYRPAKEGIVPFSIAIKRSTDHGHTWSEPHLIYNAGTYFRDGCWEPAFLELPNGEVQVYFANEKPYTTSDEQNISMLRSIDKGMSWSEEAVTVCFRAGHRDGMPVPVLLNSEIVVAIEDNVSGQFKPYTVRCTLEDNWSTPVLANSGQRESALHRQYPDQVYAGAPYLVQLPDKTTLLSYQTTYQRSANWELSTMEVAIGNEEARHFSKQTQPFDVPLNKEAKWNTIASWDKHTVVAAATTSFNSSACEVWIIKGHIIPPLALQPATIETDGVLTASEWGDLPVFIGHKSNHQLRAGIKKDAHFMYLGGQLHLSKPSEITSAEIIFFLDANNQCTVQPEKGLFKYVINTNKTISCYQGNNGAWEPYPFNGSFQLLATGDGMYTVEIKLPFEHLSSNPITQLRFTAGMYLQGLNGTVLNEWISNSMPDASYTWCKVSQNQQTN